MFPLSGKGAAFMADKLPQKQYIVHVLLLLHRIAIGCAVRDRPDVGPAEGLAGLRLPVAPGSGIGVDDSRRRTFAIAVYGSHAIFHHRGSRSAIPWFLAFIRSAERLFGVLARGQASLGDAHPSAA